MKNTQKTVALWFFLIVIAIFVFSAYEKQRSVMIPDFSYSKFKNALENKHIDNVILHQDNNEITGEISPEFIDEYGGKLFTIVGNTGDTGIKMIESYGLTPNFARGEDDSLLQNILINWLPLILIIGMFIFIMRQVQAGGGKAMSFGKSKAKLLHESKKKVTFKDVAGIEEAKEELQEIVNFLKNPRKYTRLGGRIPKGVLLVGPPGTGKTLLARAVAGEAGVPFFSISGSDFVEMFVGVGASRVRDLFEQGKKHSPCLIFIDEIDAVGRHRGSGMGGGHDEREQTLNQLLVEMDGFEDNEGVILIAATNRPDVLDPALLRPGRFDRRVMVSNPDLLGRKKILDVHTRRTPLAPKVELEKIARGTPGFSGADLENLVNEAALLAARSDKRYLEGEDFELAKDKVMLGSERRSMVISDADKKMTAYHEAGHTLVGKFLPGLDPIHKVTIIPRGMALGVTYTLPKEDSLSMSKSKATNLIAYLFGGRAAEEIIFTDYTTGAGNDIEKATSLSRRMVCEWGMSEKLGPQSYAKSEGPVFLGMQQNNSETHSDAISEEIDREVSRLIDEGYETAKRILNEKTEILHVLAKSLLEYETLNGEEVDLIYDGLSLEGLSKRRIEQEEQKEANKITAEELQALNDEDESVVDNIDVNNSDVGGSDPVTV